MKKDYKKLASMLKQVIPFTTDSTSIEIIVSEDDIEVRPSTKNITKAFYFPDTVSDFARLYSLSLYVSCEEVNGAYCVVAHLI